MNKRKKLITTKEIFTAISMCIIGYSTMMIFFKFVDYVS